jgi:hypothetical protein
VLPGDFQDPARGKTAEDLLVIRPGMDIALELPKDPKQGPESGQATIVDKLRENEVKIVPTSDAKLAVKLETRKPRSTFGEFQPRRPREPPWEQVLTLEYVVKGESVWRQEVHAPNFPRSHQSDTIFDVLSPDRKLDLTAFGRVWIPAYVARMPDGMAKAILGRFAASSQSLVPTPPQSP